VSAAPILAARDLRLVREGRTILDVTDFSVAKGEVLALAGPNGAGKTTLLLALAGIGAAVQGMVSFRSEPVTRRSSLAYRRRIAMVFQEPLLFDTTVAKNVASGLRLRGLPRPEAAERARRAMDRFGVGHLATRKARTLSGGEAQRTSLARAFATDPEILFLDEPFAALDPPTRESILRDLEATLKETGTTVIFATHDRTDALRLADRLAVMCDGRILQDGPPWEVMNRPVNGFVAAFVGVETVLPGRVVGSKGGVLTVTVSDRELEVVGEAEFGEEVLLGIRPEQITLSLGNPLLPTSARNAVTCTVAAIRPIGAVHAVELDCGFPLTAHVTIDSLEDLALAPGSPVTASVKATAIALIRKG
jgi:tungstate transport system ATP-binding protein